MSTAGSDPTPRAGLTQLGFLPKDPNKSGLCQCLAEIYNQTMKYYIAQTQSRIDKNLTRMMTIYAGQENIHTVAVQPDNIADQHFDQSYDSFLAGLLNLRTVVLPTRQVAARLVDEQAAPAPFRAIIQVFDSHSQHRLFMRRDANSSTARRFLSRHQHKFDEVALYGSDHADAAGWHSGCVAMGLGQRLDATSVHLHHAPTRALSDLNLSDNVESLGIYNVRNKGNVDNHARTSIFVERFIAGKGSSGRTKLQELHLVQTIEDSISQSEPAVITQDAFDRVMTDTTGMRVLSIHQCGGLTLNTSPLSNLSLDTVVLFVPLSQVILTEEDRKRRSCYLNEAVRDFCYHAPDSAKLVHRMPKYNPEEPGYPITMCPWTGAAKWDFSAPLGPPTKCEYFVIRIDHTNLSALQYEELVALDGYHEVWMEDAERTLLGGLYYSKEKLCEVKKEENELAKKEHQEHAHETKERLKEEKKIKEAQKEENSR
ncbi:hypothetical protein BU23DRAFT_566671 [Bimuria novae-zelandiae CBS 107.79]|uniref:Uncharacterized protein n=1 Tax=Bimuria novae-zelandiae CBS 107.79 TaxID=1447943 RepID=A0A6A5VEH7_9PLEO|nr:hypothetical protein BU23DRAFT_566671 [Bimuria novae-zelandiae CBS 107.79]